jgi:LPXTG-motif cell wall-anchored protein
MKRMTILGIFASVAFLLLAAAPSVFSDDHDKKTDVTIDQPIQVPGAILQPGTYMFILMNSASDRHIVEIKSEDGSQLYATTFTTAAQRLQQTDKVVLTFYEMPQGNPDALREWFWPGDTEGQAFLYSHKQAAEIAAATNQSVPEAPEEESALAGAPAAPPSSDVAVSAQQAPADQPAQQSPDQSTQAQQLSTQENVQEPSQQSVEQPVAQANPPSDNFRTDDTIAQNNAPAPEPSVSQTPANTADNSDSSLPKTGSDLPLVGLAGLVSIASAATLRLARRS